MNIERIAKRLERGIGTTTEGRQYLKYDLVLSYLEPHLDDEGQEILDKIYELADKVSEHNNNHQPTNQGIA